MSTKLMLDFSNVKEFSGVSPKHMPPGDYEAKVVKVIDEKSKKDNEPMWVFHIQLVDDHSATYPYYCKLVESQLWKVRNLLMAAGFKAPKSKQTVDANRLVGKTVGITLSDDEYEGKMKSVIDAIFPKAELAQTAPVEDDDDVEIEDVEVEDEEVEEDGDKFDAMDRTKLRKALRDAGLYPAKKSESDDDLRARLRDAEGGDDDEDDDEDDLEMDINDL